MPEIDLETKTDSEIDIWIQNHQDKGATDKPLYKKLLEERARLQSRGLKPDVSLAHLTKIARAGRFTTYGDLAKANEVPWNTARHAMNGPEGHLDRLLDICHARGLPLLTAICVNQAGLTTGELSDDALKGFINGAKRLGYFVADEGEFLRDWQRKCFEWAKSQSSSSG